MPEPDTRDNWEECYYIMYLDIRRGSPSSPQSAQRLSSKTTLRWGDDSPFKSSITSNASLKSPRTSSSVFTFSCSRALGSFSHSICIMPKAWSYNQQDELHENWFVKQVFKYLQILVFNMLIYLLMLNIFGFQYQKSDQFKFFFVGLIPMANYSFLI